jgi:hypothetical protein
MKPDDTRELKHAIRGMYSCDASFLRTEIVDRSLTDFVEDRLVAVFAVEHADAEVCYAWFVPSDLMMEAINRSQVGMDLPWSREGMELQQRCATARLEVPPIASAKAAVKASRDALAEGTPRAEMSIMPWTVEGH